MKFPDKILCKKGKRSPKNHIYLREAERQREREGDRQRARQTETNKETGRQTRQIERQSTKRINSIK